MHTLTPHIQTYVTHRLRCGEITPTTAVSAVSLLGKLAEVHGKRPLNQFGPATISRWREATGHLAPATKANYRANVRGFCAWLHAEGITSNDPSKAIEPVQLPRRAPVTLTAAEVAKLKAHVHHDPRASAILALLYGCGCRCVEVSRLRIDDYDPHDRTLRLRGKGGHERIVSVSTLNAATLTRYLETVGRVAGPFIRSEIHPNQGLGAKTIGIYVRRWMVEAGVKVRAHDGRSGHGLRRTAGSEVMETTGNICVVQELLGHADIETTARYYLRRVSMGQMREAMEARDHDPRHDLPDAA